MAILGQPITALASYGSVGMPYRFPIVIPVNFQLQIAGPFNPPGFIVTTNFCQVANAGIQFIVQVLDENQNPLNISGATSLMLVFQNPDGSEFTRTAQYTSNGIDGNLYYVSTATDFLEAGLCFVQAQVIVGGAVLTTMQGQFAVNGNL